MGWRDLKLLSWRSYTGADVAGKEVSCDDSGDFEIETTTLAICYLEIYRTIPRTIFLLHV